MQGLQIRGANGLALTEKLIGVCLRNLIITWCVGLPHLDIGVHFLVDGKEIKVWKSTIVTDVQIILSPAKFCISQMPAQLLNAVQVQYVLLFPNHYLNQA